MRSPTIRFVLMVNILDVTIVVENITRNTTQSTNLKDLRRRMPEHRYKYSFVGCGQNIAYCGDFQDRFLLCLQSLSEMDRAENIEFIFMDYASDEFGNGWMDEQMLDYVPTNFPIKFVRVRRENLITQEQRESRFPEVVLLNAGLRFQAKHSHRASVSCDNLYRKDFLEKVDWLWAWYYPVYLQNPVNELMLVCSRTEIPEEVRQSKSLPQIWEYVNRNLDNLQTEQLQQSFWGSVGDFTMTTQLMWERLSGHNEKMLKDSWLDLELVIWAIYNHVPVVDLLHRAGKCFFHLEHETRPRNNTDCNHMEITDIGRHNPNWGMTQGELEIVTN